MSKKITDETEFYVVSDNVRIALLRTPILEDMFWISYEIVPLTEPADPCLTDDKFWIYGKWEVYESITNKQLPNVIASIFGIDQQRGRVTLRGIHYSD